MVYNLNHQFLKIETQTFFMSCGSIADLSFIPIDQSKKL